MAAVGEDVGTSVKAEGRTLLSLRLKSIAKLVKSVATLPPASGDPALPSEDCDVGS